MSNPNGRTAVRPASRATLRQRVRTALAALFAAALAATLLIAPGTSAHAQGETLRQLAAQNGLFFGTAISPGPLANNQSYRNLAAQQFSSITHENDLKWESVQPNQGQFNYGNADAIMNFAQSNNQRVHGHTLVWHSQLPNWVQQQGTSNAALTGIVNNHIDTVAGRYAGQIDSWDVVNEPWEENGTYRNSVFYQRMGQGYIEHALRRTRQADPSTSLYINDYNTDGINAKSTAMYNLAQSLLNNGVPLDGIGFQSHLIAGQVPGNYQQNLERFAALGLEVAITELDIRIERPVTQAKLEQQARDYATVVQACLNVSACQGITVWGVSDGHSWVDEWFPETTAPLLFDNNYQPKPAYHAVVEVLGGDGNGNGNGNGNGGTPGACSANYSVVNEWNTGFQATVTVTAGSSAINGWAVDWTYGQGQGISQVWNAVQASGPPNVRMTNESYNGNLGAGQSTTFGLLGTWSGSNGVPNVSCSAT